MGCPFFPAHVASRFRAPTSDLPMHDRRPRPSVPMLSCRTSRRARERMLSAGVAQPAEHLFCKQVVGGSSPPASSTSSHLTPEGCPSGQREQAVNLPAFAYVGSNPTPSTSSGVSADHQALRPSQGLSRPRRPRRVSLGLVAAHADRDLFFQDSEVVVGGACAPRAESTALVACAPTAVSACASTALGGREGGLRYLAYRRGASGAARCGHVRSVAPVSSPVSRRNDLAGVAQLVEHQPSKLNVVGSSPISRSGLLSLFGGPWQRASVAGSEQRAPASPAFCGARGRYCRS